MVLIENNIKTMVVYFYYICVGGFGLNNLGVVTYLRIGLEVLLNVAVLVLFVKKLWEQILVMLIQTNDDRIDRKSFAEAHTIRFINVVTRYFLLSFITILFNPSFYIATETVIDLYFGSGESFDPTMYIYIIYLVRAFELTLITSVLFLNFAFNRQLYHKLCGKCHRGCLKLCISILLIHMRNKRKISQEPEINGRESYTAKLLVNEQALIIEEDSIQDADQWFM